MKTEVRLQIAKLKCLQLLLGCGGRPARLPVGELRAQQTNLQSHDRMASIRTAMFIRMHCNCRGYCSPATIGIGIPTELPDTVVCAPAVYIFIFIPHPMVRSVELLCGTSYLSVAQVPI